MLRSVAALALLIPIVGCGPSESALREQTISTLNVEADRWDGGPQFETGVADAFGRPVSSTVEKGLLNFTLELRSNGPDGLPKNSDDIVVTRCKRHGQTTLTKEASEAAEGIADGAAKGTIDGIKRGLGLGKKDE